MTSAPPVPCGRGRNNWRGRGQGQRGGVWAPHNRPVPNFMDLDYFARSTGDTWPPPDEFGVGPLPRPPPNQAIVPQFQHRGRGNQHGHGNQHGRGHQHGRGRKRHNNSMGTETKEKKMKHEENEEFKFWCDPCSRGFKDRHSWDGHQATHTTCGIDGCPYFAAAKLVKLHQELQHRTGLASKIWALESKESIDKWKEERRKNFPTKERVAEKQADLAERIERGELLETKNFGKFNNRGRDHRRGGRHDARGNRGRHNHRSRGSRGPNHNDNAAFVSNGNAETIIESNQTANDGNLSLSTSGALPGAVKNERLVGDPLSLLETVESDDNNDEEKNVSVYKRPAGIGGALGALMCDYESGNESESENVVVTSCGPVMDEAENDEFSVVVDEPETENQNHDSRQCAISNDHSAEVQNSRSENDKSDDLKKASTSIKSDDVASKSVVTAQFECKTNDDNVHRGSHEQSRSWRGRGRGRGGGPGRRGGRERRSTLLEKLLAPDIRHERNIVLQSIRHICKNNFFGLDGAAPPSGEVVEIT